MILAVAVLSSVIINGLQWTTSYLAARAEGRFQVIEKAPFGVFTGGKTE